MGLHLHWFDCVWTVLGYWFVTHALAPPPRHTLLPPPQGQAGGAWKKAPSLALHVPSTCAAARQRAATTTITRRTLGSLPHHVADAMLVTRQYLMCLDACLGPYCVTISQSLWNLLGLYCAIHMELLTSILSFCTDSLDGGRIISQSPADQTGIAW